LIIGGISLGIVLFLGLLLLGWTLYFKNITTLPTATTAPVLLVEPTRAQVDPVSEPTRPEPKPPGEIPSAVEPIRVGLLVPLTGSVQEYGISVLEGVMLSVEQWNERTGIHGRPIEILVADTRCEGEIAAAEASRLIDIEHVKFIIGEVCSIASIPVAEIVNIKKVLQISPASTNVQFTVDEMGRTRKFSFRTCFIDSFQANKLALFAYEEGFRQIFVIQDPGDVYSRNLAESFHTSFLDYGGEVVGLADIERGQEDFSAVLTRFVESKAQLLFVPAYYDVVNRIGRQARELGLEIKMLGGDGWDSPALDLRALVGSFYSTHFNPVDPNPEVRAWVDLYGSRYKTEAGTPKLPNAFAALGYDSANLLFQALDAVGQAEPTLIAEFLEGYEARLLTGVMRYDEQHNPIKPLVIMGIRSDGVYFARQIEP
jgi:branched-chain amino acid transport system substrate-binding protein